MACPHLPGALAEGHDHVQVDSAEGRLGASLFDRGTQAAEGDIDATGQLRQEQRGIADRVFQVRVCGQGAAGRGQYSADGRLAEQPIE
ncbi:hypothetical protein D3C75_781330 [compost metagenome]